MDRDFQKSITCFAWQVIHLQLPISDFGEDCSREAGYLGLDDEDLLRDQGRRSEVIVNEGRGGPLAKARACLLGFSRASSGQEGLLCLLNFFIVNCRL